MATLNKAILIGVDFSGANLSGTDLYGVDLFDSNLNEVIFEGTDLSEARIGGTWFGNVDLAQAKGLDTVEHSGPSYVDLRTIYRSRGKIPEKFLRGTGAADAIIDYAASLAEQDVRYASCYIGFVAEDEEVADRLYGDFQQNGLRCWLLPEPLTSDSSRKVPSMGPKWASEKLVIILSEGSMQSDWLQNQVSAALKQETKAQATILFPIRLDATITDAEAPWAAELGRNRTVYDFSQWQTEEAYRQAFEPLLRELEATDGGAI